MRKVFNLKTKKGLPKKITYYKKGNVSLKKIEVEYTLRNGEKRIVTYEKRYNKK
jgi:hypothetical protein